LYWLYRFYSKGEKYIFVYKKEFFRFSYTIGFNLPDERKEKQNLQVGFKKSHLFFVEYSNASIQSFRKKGLNVGELRIGFQIADAGK